MFIHFCKLHDILEKIYAYSMYSITDFIYIFVTGKYLKRNDVAKYPNNKKKRLIAFAMYYLLIQRLTLKKRFLSLQTNKWWQYMYILTYVRECLSTILLPFHPLFTIYLYVMNYIILKRVKHIIFHHGNKCSSSNGNESFRKQ